MSTIATQAITVEPPADRLIATQRRTTISAGLAAAAATTAVASVLRAAGIYDIGGRQMSTRAHLTNGQITATVIALLLLVTSLQHAWCSLTGTDLLRDRRS